MRTFASLLLAAAPLFFYLRHASGVDSLSTPHSLVTTDGETIVLGRALAGDYDVICFLGTECPLAKLYGPRLQAMADGYAERGVRFVGVNSNIQDSMDELRQYVADHAIRFPVAKDYDRRLAMALDAERTPEVFVIDQTGAVRYRGRIDDQYEPGVAKPEPTSHELRSALEQLLAGDPVRVSRTEAVGCLIALPRSQASQPSQEITFCDQVIRVLNEHCVDCHREGAIGPFVLNDYDEVIGWADMCLEVIEQGRMPPWHASPRHGSFANERHMPAADQRLLRQWVEAGMPYGDPAKLPEVEPRVARWRLPRSPDAVFAMADQPYRVPAEGTVDYQYFVVDPKFDQDRWVSAVEVMPGNSSVVHHCIAFTRPPDGSDIRDIGMLGAYVPGQLSAAAPQGFAQRIKAGSKIVFQMHYTPNGKPQTDLTKIGLVFADPDDVTHEIIALGGIEQEFEIPPFAKNHSVQGKIEWFPNDALLLAITPHMHLRGKSFQMTAHRSDGAEILLKVPRYDFNWQHRYELKNPLPLEDVRSLAFTANFDNSRQNPFNPDPSETVTWGDQTWQEMAVTFVEVARPVRPKEAASMRNPSPPDARLEAEQRTVYEKAQAFADRYIARFDRNGDGSVADHELPSAVRKFGYLDHNNDGHVSRDELVNEASARMWQDR